MTPGAADLALASPLFPSVTITLAGRSPPRRASPGGGGVPPLHPRTDRLGHRTAAHRDPGAAAPTSSSPAGPPAVGTFPGCRRRSSRAAAPSTSRSRDRPTRRGAPRRPTPRRPTGPASSRPWATPLQAAPFRSLRASPRPSSSASPPRMSARRRSRGTRRRGPADHRSPLRRALSSSSHRAGPPPTTCAGPKPATVALTLAAGAAGNYTVQFSLRTGLGLTLPPVDLDMAVQP